MHTLSSRSLQSSRAGTRECLRLHNLTTSGIMRGIRVKYLPEHICLRDLAIFKEELAGVAAAHAQLVQLLRRLEALHAASMGSVTLT